MPAQDPIKNFAGFMLAGKVGNSNGFGFGRYGVNKFGKYNAHYGIYQRRMTRKGKISVLLRFMRPTNPRTDAQQDNRQRFTSAMSAWTNSSDSVKNQYRERAKKRNMFGWGLFIREYMQNFVAGYGYGRYGNMDYGD